MSRNTTALQRRSGRRAKGTHASTHKRKTTLPLTSLLPNRHSFTPRHKCSPERCECELASISARVQPKRQRFESSTVRSDIIKIPFSAHTILCVHRAIPHTQTTAMWVLTSSRRLLSLTGVSRGGLSFLASGFEDAVLVLCFLEGFSWFAVKKKRQGSMGWSLGLFT